MSEKPEKPEMDEVQLEDEALDEVSGGVGSSSYLMNEVNMGKIMEQQ